MTVLDWNPTYKFYQSVLVELGMSSQLLNVEVCIAKLIVDFLGFKELYVFINCVTKRIRSSLNKNIRKRVLNNCLKTSMYTFMKTFVTQPLDFFTIMEKYKAVIAGGFVVAIFMGKLDEKSDMDVYVKDAKNLGIELEALGFVINTTSGSEYNDYVVVTYSRDHKNIQLIEFCPKHPMCPRQPTHKTVVKIFDLTHCMCSISKIKNNVGESHFHFTCDHLNNILTSTMDLNYDYEYNSIYKLPLFTYAYGFNNEHLFTISIGVATTMSRIRKYEKRGFKCSEETSILLFKWNKFLQDKISDLQQFSTVFMDSEVCLNKTS